MECFGLELAGSILPPFELHAGEALCLHIEHSTIPWYEGILKLLRGDISDPQLRVDGQVRYLERPMPGRGWFGRRKNMLPGNWLVNEVKLSPTEANRILNQLNVNPDLRIGWMGWNERTLLALEAYFVHSPDLLVFDTSGNDYQGIHTVFSRLDSRPPSMAVIYLKTNPGSMSPCFAGAKCIDLAIPAKYAISGEPSL